MFIYLKKKNVVFVQLIIFNIYRNKLKKGCFDISNQKQEVKIDKYFENPNDMSFIAIILCQTGDTDTTVLC